MSILSKYETIDLTKTLKLVKNHLKITNDLSDIKLEITIRSAIKIIWENYMLLSLVTFPDTEDGFSSNVKLAICHQVDTLWNNPDDHIETNNKVASNNLIFRILGSELGY